MPPNVLLGDLLLRHRDGAGVYPGSLESGALLLHYHAGGSRIGRFALGPRVAPNWLMTAGTDADLAAIRAAGLAVGDGRKGGANAC